MESFREHITFLKGALDTHNPQTYESHNYRNWITQHDIKTCLFCSSMHGKIFRRLEEPEISPPVHPWCRCRITSMQAVLAGEATKDGQEGADWWLKTHGKLPDYYVSFSEAKRSGWEEGKELAKFLPNKMISRGIYRNYNKHLPDAPGRIWYEADINYYSGSRNSHRILWSNDGLIFVTFNHYVTFLEIV